MKNFIKWCVSNEAPEIVQIVAGITTVLFVVSYMFFSLFIAFQVSAFLGLTMFFGAPVAFLWTQYANRDKGES